MPDVFISYSREDRAIARQFAEALAHEGLDVWWDVALRSGEVFDMVIERALSAARAVIVLWSPRSVESRWVRAEATQADVNGTLAPVMIEPCKRPIIFELTHTTDLTHWTGDPADKAWCGFVDDLRLMMARAPAAPAPRDPPASVRDPEQQAERRQVAVLNATISDMTGADPDLDPEDWREIVVRFQALAVQIVAQYGGYAEAQPGDALIGMFGVDRTQEDDAYRAVRAGLAIVEMAPGLATRSAPPLAARVGIDAGLMVAGGAGAASFGAPITQAALLQAQA
ncbi:MAG TPA: TIR domain-containing protein, partial [Phenylobacterium sp.]|nr:TIR domain-containing protein [Phenylobacterium sp.]